MKKQILFFCVCITLLITIMLLNSCSKNEPKVPAANTSYKLLKEKTETGEILTPMIEFYLSTDRNWDQMYSFVKNRKVSDGIFYHAVFVDDEKYANFSKYPITAMTFDKGQSKHIIATYWYNTKNGNREFTYYEKNSFDSVPKTRHD